MLNPAAEEPKPESSANPHDSTEEVGVERRASSVEFDAEEESPDVGTSSPPVPPDDQETGKKPEEDGPPASFSWPFNEEQTKWGIFGGVSIVAIMALLAALWYRSSPTPGFSQTGDVDVEGNFVYDIDAVRNDKGLEPEDLPTAEPTKPAKTRGRRRQKEKDPATTAAFTLTPGQKHILIGVHKAKSGFSFKSVIEFVKKNSTIIFAVSMLFGSTVAGFVSGAFTNHTTAMLTLIISGVVLFVAKKMWPRGPDSDEPGAYHVYILKRVAIIALAAIALVFVAMAIPELFLGHSLFDYVASALQGFLPTVAAALQYVHTQIFPFNHL